LEQRATQCSELPVVDFPSAVAGVDVCMDIDLTMASPT
jgi:hypothetical protein